MQRCDDSIHDVFLSMIICILFLSYSYAFFPIAVDTTIVVHQLVTKQWLLLLCHASVFEKLHCVLSSLLACRQCRCRIGSHHCVLLFCSAQCAFIYCKLSSACMY